ncbi:hypothetical protein J5N97_005955 [Dioscorea zingiberensis]|uniref:Germin-like protein n=1 Tax=Dioscorea zingiberensis TaxID=325984 RepID=A0A9D5DA14_9LILI|nr:hypothetical protein J5N97_005955 [Dioscorea zingiberensis]
MLERNPALALTFASQLRRLMDSTWLQLLRSVGVGLGSNGEDAKAEAELVLVPFQVVLFIISSSNAALVQDFCVGDLSVPEGPAGYSCKTVSDVTTDDFVFTGFRNPANTSNSNKVSVIPAFAAQWPALNGLGISVASVEFAPGGRAPMHTHPAGSELIVITEGAIIAGFISSANKVYYKTLETNDAMIFPQGLIHFQVNVGSVTSKGVVSFSSSNPGLQFTSLSLFGNDLPSEILETVSFIGDAEVKKLKAMLGGTN